MVQAEGIEIAVPCWWFKRAEMLADRYGEDKDDIFDQLGSEGFNEYERILGQPTD